MATPTNTEEMAHRATSNAELIAWVDEQNRPLDNLPCAKLRKRRLVGRSTFTLLFNSASKLCMQCRTLNKVVHPGYWDLTADDTIQAGEPHADSAAHESEGELGVRDAVLREHGHFFFDEPGSRLWCAVFFAIPDVPLRLQAEEISEACFTRPELALEGVRSPPYCPDSLQALRLYLDTWAADVTISPINGVFSLLAFARNAVKLCNLSERSPCRPCTAPV